MGIAAALVLLLVGVGGAWAAGAVELTGRSKAQSVAAAVNLRHSDLPTLSVQSNTLTAHDKALNAQVTACIGETPESEFFADVRSPNFVGPAPSSLTISSETQILPSVSMVTKDLAAIRRPHALSCLVNELDTEFRATFPKSDTVGTSIVRLPSVVTGTDGAFAIRVTTVIHVKHGTTLANVTVYDDEIGFAYGQAEVALTVSSTLTKPSSSLERHLAALLVQRASSAIG